MTDPKITLTENDYLRLDHILGYGEFEDLEFEVSRAKVISSEEVPSDLITMHTHFRYQNLTDNKLGEMTIVYPDEANLDERKISVLAPLGSAFIGLREGDEVEWPFPDGSLKRLKVLKVLSSGERGSEKTYH